MIPAHVIAITTPKKFLLNGLWFGPKKPKRVVIWVHGLCSSAFSRLSVVEKLTDPETAVMTFNNRGHDSVSRVSRINPRKKDGYDRITAGGAHEVFTECVDDIQGAVDFALAQGAKDIYLIGHSTGCQKSIYYAAKKKDAPVKGVILLAPISDYAAALKIDGKGKIARGEKAARALVRRKKPQQIVPGFWMDAQRFLSLNTPDSAEEMFTYAQPKKRPRLYASVKLPILALFAENDEYGDRPAGEIEAWFHASSGSRAFEGAVIAKADHSFKGAEEDLVRRIRGWILAQ